MLKNKYKFSKKKGDEFIRKLRHIVGRDLIGFVFLKPVEKKAEESASDKDDRNKSDKPNIFIVLRDREQKDIIINPER